MMNGKHIRAELQDDFWLTVKYATIRQNCKYPQFISDNGEIFQFEKVMPANTMPPGSILHKPKRIIYKRIQIVPLRHLKIGLSLHPE
jgi:hypothetical protein